MTTPKEIVEFAKQNDVEMVDLKFIDFLGTWQHFTVPVSQLNEEMLEEIAEEHGDKVTIAKVNTDENQAVASQHGIMSIPTMMLFKNGEKIDQMVAENIHACENRTRSRAVCIPNVVNFWTTVMGYRRGSHLFEGSRSYDQQSLRNSV